MYRDLLWQVIILHCVPVQFKNHWNLFSDIYHLCKSVCNPHFPALAAIQENLFEDVWGHLMVPYLTLLCAHQGYNFSIFFSQNQFPVSQCDELLCKNNSSKLFFQLSLKKFTHQATFVPAIHYNWKASVIREGGTVIFLIGSCVLKIQLWKLCQIKAYELFFPVRP